MFKQNVKKADSVEFEGTKTDVAHTNKTQSLQGTHSVEHEIFLHFTFKNRVPLMR